MTTPAPETPAPTPLPDDRLPSPCPFCGTQLIGHGDGDDMWEHPFVGCHADCQVLFNAKDIAAWNRRVPPLPWFDLSSAPRDGTPIWGRVDQDARRMLWHDGFGAFVASWRRMTLADGMTFDDTGLSHKDHSPEIVNADAWMPMPGTEVRAPPPGQAALAEALRAQAFEEAASAVERAAVALDQRKCCGVGISNPYGGPPECCSDPLYMLSSQAAAAAIRALAAPATGDA